MNIPPVLFLLVIFLGLFNGLSSSNPDSIIVQSPEDNEARAAQILEQEKQQQISEHLEEFHGKNLEESNGEDLVKSRAKNLEESHGKNSEESRTKNLEESRGMNLEESLRGNLDKSRQKSNQRNFKESRGGNLDESREVVLRFIQKNPIISEILFAEINGQRFQRIRDSNGFLLTSRPYGYYPSYSNRRAGNQNGYDGRPRFRPQVSQNRIRVNNENGNSGIFSASPGAYESEDVNSGITVIPNGYQVPKNNAKGSNNNDHENSKPFSDSFGTSSNGGANGKETIDASSFPIPQNNDKGNNNNAQAISKPVDVTTGIPEADEVFFDDDNIQANPSTKSVKRISPDSNFFAGIVNDFAFKLMYTINLESNFVISPLSIYIALAMCYLGSDGRTKAQLEQALGMNDNAVRGEHLHKGIKDLISAVREETPGYQLFLANGMLLGKNFTVDNQFEQLVRRYYDAEIHNLDFADAELSLRFINKWVADNTRNMITSIINSPPPPLTRLVLLNAIFFKGIWKMQFPIHLTKNGKFQTLNRTEQEVEFMNLYGETFPVFRSPKHRHTFLKLPYMGDEVSMIIALPFTALDKPMPTIKDENLKNILGSMVNMKFHAVTIPKFRLEDKNSLRKPLQELGVTNIFNRNMVDLRKLRKENDVYVSGIIHKAIIEVDEVGTTASAVTQVRILPLSAPRSFVANHPFAFYVIHEPTGLVLFCGKVFDFESEENVSKDRRQNVTYRQKRNSQACG